MTAEIVASSFVEFMENEFLRSAVSPYDDMLVQARAKHGRLENDVHLVQVPSILLSGKEDIEAVHTMNARAAMICNGDLALQLDSGPHGGAVRSIDLYEDEKQRTRLRIIWA
jgi:hypothetical protein